MRIKVTNDHKEKAMSFEATLEGLSVSKTMFFGSAEAIGYGATEQEARQNLLLCLRELVENLELVKQDKVLND